MTEREWLTSDNPQLMLTQLNRNYIRDERKLRLFACACCRQILTDPHGLEAVEIAERYADGKATQAQVKQAVEQYERLTKDFSKTRLLTLICFWSTQRLIEMEVEHFYSHCLAPSLQATILRDLVGNQWQYWTWGGTKPMPRWPEDFPWLTSTALNIAQNIYNDQDFGSMPVLADALEDAGCDNEDILRHLHNNQEPHVRGCWALDLILGK